MQYRRYGKVMKLIIFWQQFWKISKNGLLGWYWVNNQPLSFYSLSSFHIWYIVISNTNLLAIECFVSCFLHSGMCDEIFSINHELLAGIRLELIRLMRASWSIPYCRWCQNVMFTYYNYDCSVMSVNIKKMRYMFFWVNNHHSISVYAFILFILINNIVICNQFN